MFAHGVLCSSLVVRYLALPIDRIMRRRRTCAAGVMTGPDHAPC